LQHAAEMATHCPHFAALLNARLGHAQLESMSHEALKLSTGTARAIVRTGECTPYANVVLYAGVVF